MIKILHSADWHLDAPLGLSDGAQRERLRREMAKIPERIVALCKENSCDILLLAGDLLDGAYAADTLQSLKNALQKVGIPVFITPGNHDFVGPDSPWLSESFSDNVHIFTHPAMESVELPELDCRVYGAGFLSPDCPGLLADFEHRYGEKYAIGVLHGDPTQVSSPYNPITKEQVKSSGLSYLALGHIHKGGAFTAGSTLCAWPGCPMGHGFDETGEKGVLLVTVDETATAEFIPLDTPRFYDLEVPAEKGPDSVLPPVGSEDFYRITLTGPSEPLDLEQLKKDYAHFPNLVLRDRTTPPLDIWGSTDADSLEGMFFGALKEQNNETATLAAKISRQILNGQEVTLP